MSKGNLSFGQCTLTVQRSMPRSDLTYRYTRSERRSRAHGQAAGGAKWDLVYSKCSTTLHRDHIGL